VGGGRERERGHPPTKAEVGMKMKAEDTRLARKKKKGGSLAEHAKLLRERIKDGIDATGGDLLGVGGGQEVVND